MRGRERDLECACSQQHDRGVSACLVCQKLGVSGKRHTGGVDDPFVYGRGHHRMALLSATKLSRQLQLRQHLASVIRIEKRGCAGLVQWDVNDGQGIGAMFRCVLPTRIGR